MLFGVGRVKRVEHIWKSEKIIEASNFIKLVRKLIRNKEESEWREAMNEKSKLRLYRQIKNKLKLEEYVVELERKKTSNYDKRRSK